MNDAAFGGLYFKINSLKFKIQHLTFSHVITHKNTYSFISFLF